MQILRTPETRFAGLEGYDFAPTSNSLAVYIRYLRQKLESAGRPRLIHTLGSQEPQLRLDVVGPVPADGDVRQFDTQLEQPVGDPRTVAIGHPSGEDFGSRHHDARARTHVVRHYAHRT